MAIVAAIAARALARVRTGTSFAGSSVQVDTREALGVNWLRGRRMWMDTLRNDTDVSDDASTAIGRPEELPGSSNLIETESRVQVPRPVILVGDDEDVPRAGLPRCPDGPQDDRASDAPAAEAFERANVLDLCVVPSLVQLAVARQLAIHSCGEESRTRDTLVLAVLFGEDKRDVLRQVGVLPVHLLDEGSHHSERDLLHRQIGVPVGISPVAHGYFARRGETESLERMRDELGQSLILQDDQSMLVPGPPEDPLPRFDQRRSRRATKPLVGKEEVRVVAPPVLLVQVRDAELEPLQTCAESFEPSSFELEGTRQFVHAARVTRGHGERALKTVDDPR